MRLSVAAAAAFVLCAPLLLSSPASAAQKDNGKKITIDVQQADVVNVVRLISDVSGLNIVVADDVKGKVTIKLKNIPWRQALDVILKSGGFGYVQEGDILWVAPQARIDAEEQASLDKGAAQELKGPLTTRIIPINYARAEEMIALVKPLLTARGTVTADARTNVLIIRDVRSSAALKRF
ncbi:MAG: secretin and TonB N-terminal domain-containing protein [Deltaproteobacteria bacterium]|nr:secretin and TonB N-terminal domain-containing protein [Deltaproteobacteria bacterium]